MKGNYVTKMDSLKQTFEDERVALSMFTQTLLQSVMSTGSDDVRIVGGKGVRTLISLSNPPFVFSRSIPGRTAPLLPVDTQIGGPARLAMALTHSSYGNLDTGLWPGRCE